MSDRHGNCFIETSFTLDLTRRWSATGPATGQVTVIDALTCAFPGRDVGHYGIHTALLWSFSAKLLPDSGEMITVTTTSSSYTVVVHPHVVTS